MAYININIETKEIPDISIKEKLDGFIKSYPRNTEDPFSVSVLLGPPSFSCELRYSSGSYNDNYKVYDFIERFFHDLGREFPALTAAADCKYDPDEKNFEQGFDDHGGYYSIELQDGVVTVEDIPIV